MYFDFDDRLYDTPTVESAMSWRERGLLSLFVHLLAVALVLVVPRLPFVQSAAQRQAELLAEIAEEQRLALLEQRQNEPEFIFVEPLVDTPAPEPPLLADLSDIDRVAQSPLQSETPLNDLPNADGNSLEFVEAEVPVDGPDPVTELGEELEASEADALEPVDGAVEGVADAPAPESPDPAPGDFGALRNPFLADRGDPGRERPPTERPQLDQPEALLNQAMRRLQGVGRTDTFRNLQGRNDQYGDDIQFDSKGVDFGSWIRRFRAQIYRNWFLPQAAMVLSGHVVLTFNIHRDGTLTDLAVAQPSLVDAFTNSAFNALRGSNPTQPLPPEYPDDQVFFTVIFYFNERPPGR